MAPESTALTTRVMSGSPYQLAHNQVLKASTALLSHIHTTALKTAESSDKKSLLAPSSPSTTPPPSETETLWLLVTTKKPIVSHNRLKPNKITLPHSLNTSPESSICLITPDPQRTFKDVIAHPSFPPQLGKRITRVISISKLKAKYKSFESRRQLKAEHDVIFADARVITMLPQILGKTFYAGGTKRPVPVDLEPYKPRKDASEKPNPFSVVRKVNPSKEDGKPVAPPQQCAREIERALSSALIHKSPGATISVRIGLSTFTPAQVVQNIEAVVNGMVEKHVTNGWRNVKAIHIKGPNTAALPIWLAEEAMESHEDVLEAEEVEEAQRIASQKGMKKRKRALTDGRGGEQLKIEGPKNGPGSGKKRESEAVDADLSSEMRGRREKLRKQKAEVRDAEEKLSRKANQHVDGPVKAKRRKLKNAEGFQIPTS